MLASIDYCKIIEERTFYSRHGLLQRWWFRVQVQALLVDRIGDAHRSLSILRYEHSSLLKDWSLRIPNSPGSNSLYGYAKVLPEVQPLGMTRSKDKLRSSSRLKFQASCHLQDDIRISIDLVIRSANMVPLAHISSCSPPALRKWTLSLQ